VITTKKNNIWVGTLGNGIFAYDSMLNPLPDPLRINNRTNYAKMGIWHLAQRKNGDTWVGAQSGNLIVFDSDDYMLADITPTILEKKSIRQVVEDDEGNMWLGTEGGHLVKCIKGDWADTINAYKLVHKVDGRIMKIMHDPKGIIWTATEQSGVFKFDSRTGKELAHYDDKTGPGRNLTSVFASDLIQYNDSLLLIANGNISILNTSRNTISYFSAIDGLPSNQVGGLFKDKAGHVWIMLSDGLCRLNVEKKVVSVFDVKDGITEDNFEVSSTSSLPGGRIAMGTLHDFLLFNPDQIDQQAIPLNVRITDIKLAGRSLTVDSIQKLNKLSLSYTENNITIDYSVLTYMHQNRIVYYHKLEGLDKDWIRCDYHQAVYHYLPPGKKYTFKIKSVDGKGNVSEQETTLDIVISAPFWKTWWFYAALVLIAISIFYLIDKERIRKLVALQQMRTQIAGNLHRELNSTLNNINLLSEMAKLKADKDIIRSKEYIDQISDKSSKMIISMDDMLWSLDPQNDNMGKTILRMHEFTDALRNRHSADIQMVSEEKVHSLELDMKSRHEFFLLFKLALRMVIEQAHGKKVLINIDLVRPKLSLKLNDSEASLDMSAAETENYFMEMKGRAKEINALLDVQADNKGTSIILLVPVV
jgi:Y_Y_Y domain